MILLSYVFDHPVTTAVYCSLLPADKLASQYNFESLFRQNLV